MASAPRHALSLILVQIFSPSCDDWSGVAEDGAGEQELAQIDVLFSCRYEDVKRLVWWGDRLVGSRGFITGPGSIGSSCGVFRRQLKRSSQTKLLDMVLEPLQCLDHLGDLLISASGHRT